jgi:hypothetical protein
MSNDTEEFDLDDDSVSNDETNNETGDDETPEESTKRNKSNFKELYKKTKTLEKQLSEERADKARLARENEAWRSENPDLVTKTFSSNDMEAINEKIFIVANPEAKAHFDKVKERATKYGMPLEEAWEDVQLRLPKESTTSVDFEIKGKSKSDKIDLKKVSAEDSASLSKEERAKWREIHGWNK